MPVIGMDFVTAFEQGASWTGGWLPLSAIGLAISGALVALGWMAAEALRGSEIRSWSRKELNEFIISCVIVGTVAFLLSTLYTLSLALADGKDFFTVAEGYFNDKEAGLFYQTLKAAQSITGKSFVYELIGDLQFDMTKLLKDMLWLVSLVPGAQAAAGLATFLPGIVTKPFGSADDISSGLDGYISMAFFTALLAYAQVEALRFFKYAALQFVFPAGIMLRAFPISRKVGSTLIAFALVGAVVYPLSVVGSKAIYDQTSQLFGSPAIEVEAPTPLGVAVVSPQDGTRLTLDDTIKWGVENGSAFRIWKSQEDYGCTCPSATCIKAPVQPPPLSRYPNIDEWSNNVTMFECLRLAASGTAEGYEVEVRISDIIASDASDRLYSFVLDAYNGTQPRGWAEAKVMVGNPCKANYWTQARCLLGHRYTISQIDTARGAMALTYPMLEGGLGEMWKTALETIKSPFTGNPLKTLATPMAAAHILLRLSEELPALLYPQMMVLLTLVMSAFISLSAFRGISEAVGGETELPGLAKVI